MTYLTIVFIVLVVQCVESDTVDQTKDGFHDPGLPNTDCIQKVYFFYECLFCVGEEYECINGICYCADGYISDSKHRNCMRCPGVGEKCFGPCCSANNNETLQCWHGICQSCYGPLGNWVCRDSMDQIIFVSGSQIVMAVALVLGMIATFTLIYKLCAVNDLRTLGTSSNEGRLSIGSLQLYVDERLRDAPPRYSRAAPAGSSIYPASHLNAGFIHDNSLPPPLYEERKDENVPNITHTVHM